MCSTSRVHPWWCRRYSGSIKRMVTEDGQEQTGLVLPFEPLNLTWQHIYYSVDVPAGSDLKGDQVMEHG